MVDSLPKPDDFHAESDRSTDTQFSELAPFNWRLNLRSPAWRPPSDVFETETSIVVRVEIAGMREGDFAIELNGRFLSIRGFRQDLAERRAFHQMEIRFGEFNLDLELPTYVEPDQVQAVYTDGFLRVTLPKARPRQITLTD